MTLHPRPATQNGACPKHVLKAMQGLARTTSTTRRFMIFLQPEKTQHDDFKLPTFQGLTNSRVVRPLQNHPPLIISTSDTSGPCPALENSNCVLVAPSTAQERRRFKLPRASSEGRAHRSHLSKTSLERSLVKDQLYLRRVIRLGLQSRKAVKPFKPFEGLPKPTPLPPLLLTHV